MKRVHVEIGLESYDAPVVQEWPDDPFWKDYIKVQKDPHTTALMHKRWVRCLDDEAPATTTCEEFLRTHWDKQRNCLGTDYLEEFYQLYRSCHNPKPTVGTSPVSAPAMVATGDAQGIPHTSPHPVAPCTPSPAPSHKKKSKKAVSHQPQQLELNFDW